MGRRNGGCTLRLQRRFLELSSLDGRRSGVGVGEGQRRRWLVRMEWPPYLPKNCSPPLFSPLPSYRWLGELNGKQGFFPATHVRLQESA